MTERNVIAVAPEPTKGFQQTLHKYLEGPQIVWFLKIVGSKVKFTEDIFQKIDVLHRFGYVIGVSAVLHKMLLKGRRLRLQRDQLLSKKSETSTTAAYRVLSNFIAIFMCKCVHYS